MSFKFTKTDINKIAKTLDVTPIAEENHVKFILDNKEAGRKLALEIYNQIPIGNSTGNLISVYTSNSHLQLHFCSGYVVSTMLGEVTFIGEDQDKLSGLTIEKQAACSLYSNVDKKLLSGDFTQLGPEVMLSGIALSLTEHLL
ncbi:hypothetical protein ACFL6O_03360 [candidate division KSB1 bacterium]